MKKIFFGLLIGALFLSSRPGFSKTVRFGEILCADPRFSCVEIEEGDKWDSLWPDEEKRNILRRLNRMNIRLRKGMKIALPKNLESVTLLEIAPFPKKIESGGEKEVRVDLNRLAWGAYDAEGNLVDWGPASGGKSWCPDVGYACRTPAGEYRVFGKGGAKCKSSKFPIPKGGAPMPYCMHFKPGYALHGSYEVPGFNASHGCVRLYPEDAKRLNEDFIETPNKENAYRGTKVVILPYSDPDLPESKPAESKAANPQKN